MSEKIHWILPVEILLSIIQWILFILASLLQAIYRNFFPYAMQPKKQIAGRTVLITGAGGGIGSEIARLLAEEGCRLILWDNNTILNDTTASLCQKLGAKVGL